MSKTLVTGVFIFSLALNLAVAGTVGLNWWMERRSPQLASPSEEMPFSKQELKQLRKAWHREQREAMHELREKIFEKRAEVLDLIAANPGNPSAAEKSLGELIALKGEMEKKAFTGTMQLLASLPEEKRAQFLSFLKSRTCSGPGMGMGPGRRHKMRGPRGACPPEGAPSPDAKNFSRDSAPTSVSK